MPTLDFKGKQHIYAHHLSVPYRQLIPDESKSVSPGPDSGNLIIHGDNLHALKALLPTYAGRVKCIYIDPPYNTGNEGWIYNDKVNSPLMRQWLTENGAVDGEDLERHEKWLCMMWPRLQLLRELLSEEGAIFVSIDDNEQHHLRMIMDEIFGERNFFAVLTRRAMHTVRNSSKDFNHNADYVLVYAKDKAWFGEDKSRYIRHIVDKSSNYPHDDGDDRGRYKLDPIHARNYYEPYTFVFGNGVEWQPPEGRYPSYSQETLRQMENEGRIDFSGNEPRAKRYLAEVQEGQPPDVFLSSEYVGFNLHGTQELSDIFGRGGVFPQPKPTKLVMFLLDLLRDENAIVLDSFGGSGTTAHAVLALNAEDGGNRRFVLVECLDYADDITAARVRLVINGVSGSRDESLRQGLGGGFQYCTLGEEIGVESMLRGENLPDYDSLAAYLLYCATGVAVDSADIANADDESDGFFYETERVRYHMFYQPDAEWLRGAEGALNYSRASAISEAAREVGKAAVVFAPVKFVSHEDILSLGITFCQLPYELTASRAQALEM